MEQNKEKPTVQMIFQQGVKNYGTMSGDVVNYFYGDEHTPSEKDSEELLMAIDDLMDAVDEEGNKIFTDQSQWYAVYRVLNEKLNYPQKMTDFQRTMQKMDLDKMEVPCVYSSLKQGSQQCPKLVANVDVWEQYKNLSDKYNKQYIIAEYLLKKLGFKE